VRDAGGVVEATICYTGDVSTRSSSKYTLEYYLGLADALVAHGTHSLAIKDMAGLLKPRAAEMLIGALRSRFPDLPLHVHTHDTAGTGVATQLAAAAAGADIIDCCIDSMSGTTSQPSMGAIVHSLAGTELDTGIDPEELLPLMDYWDLTRAVYAPFESTLRSPSSEVYYHEMPGGFGETLTGVSSLKLKKKNQNLLCAPALWFITRLGSRWHGVIKSMLCTVKLHIEAGGFSH